MAVELTDMDTLILHIPKCGGTFVEYVSRLLAGPIDNPPAVGGQCPKHGTRSNYRAYKKTLCVVRHPVHWIESWWRFNVGKIWNPDDFPYEIPYAHELLPIHCRVGDNFDALVRTILDECPGLVTRIFDLYVSGCDAVMRLETIGEDLQRLLELSQHRVDRMPLQNVSRPNRVACWAPSVLQEWMDAEKSILDRWYTVRVRPVEEFDEVDLTAVQIAKAGQQAVITRFDGELFQLDGEAWFPRHLFDFEVQHEG